MFDIMFRAPAGRAQVLTELVVKQGLHVGGAVPQDDTVVDYDLVGRSLFELPENTLPLFAAIRHIAER